MFKHAVCDVGVSQGWDHGLVLSAASSASERIGMVAHRAMKTKITIELAETSSLHHFTPSNRKSLLMRCEGGRKGVNTPVVAHIVTLAVVAIGFGAVGCRCDELCRVVWLYEAINPRGIILVAHVVIRGLAFAAHVCTHVCGCWCG